MTDHEINKLVAEKVMRFTTREFGWDKTILCWETPDKEGDGFFVPDYCNDLNAAFEAWSRYRSTRDCDGLNFTYWCGLVGAGFLGTQNAPFAENEAKALCLALLKAVGVLDEIKT